MLGVYLAGAWRAVVSRPERAVGIIWVYIGIM